MTTVVLCELLFARASVQGHRENRLFSVLNQPNTGFWRIACAEPCQVEHPALGIGFLWNLSVRGVYLVIDPIPGEGERLRISFHLPGDAKPIKVDARVAWRNAPSALKGCGQKVLTLPPGCGLEFLAITSVDRQRIEVFVKSSHPPGPGYRGAS